MNGKYSKKVRKIIRKNVGDGMMTLGKLTRKRPRFIPKFIWILLYVPLFKFKYLKVVYKFL